MGKVAECIDQFLENGGKSLGYDEGDIPAIKDMDNVLNIGIKVWEYYGMTQNEYWKKKYYGGK